MIFRTQINYWYFPCREKPCRISVPTFFFNLGRRLFNTMRYLYCSVRAMGDVKNQPRSVSSGLFCWFSGKALQTTRRSRWQSQLDGTYVHKCYAAKRVYLRCNFENVRSSSSAVRIQWLAPRSLFFLSYSSEWRFGDWIRTIDHEGLLCGSHSLCPLIHADTLGSLCRLHVHRRAYYCDDGS